MESAVIFPVFFGPSTSSSSSTSTTPFSSGTIRFIGTPEINPRLDIRAQREISGVIASVRVTGALDAPELELSSEPPLDDAEILSLIVFNQPLSLLGTGAQVSLATRAPALASAFVASQLTDSLGEVLELDLLEIEAATADGSLTPVLTLGEQIGRLSSSCGSGLVRTPSARP